MEVLNNKFYNKSPKLSKEQLSLRDFSLPKNLYNFEYAKLAHEALISFLRENDGELLDKCKNEKVFSKEHKLAREQKYFEDTLFFIHHDGRLNEWLSYDFKDKKFKNIYDYLKSKGFYLDKLENNVSGIFISFGFKHNIKFKI